MSSGSQSASASSYRTQSLLFYTVGWAERNRAMKRSRSEIKATMYVRTALKWRNLTRMWLEIGTSAGIHINKEEMFLDERQPAAFLALSKERSTAMGELIKKIDAYTPFTTQTSKRLRKNTSSVSERIRAEVLTLFCLALRKTYNRIEKTIIRSMMCLVRAMCTSCMMYWKISWSQEHMSRALLYCTICSLAQGFRFG